MDLCGSHLHLHLTRTARSNRHWGRGGLSAAVLNNDWGYRFLVASAAASVDDADQDVVVGAFEEHLTFEVYEAAFLGRFKGSDESLVVLRWIM